MYFCLTEQTKKNQDAANNCFLYIPMAHLCAYPDYINYYHSHNRNAWLYLWQQ